MFETVLVIDGRLVAAPAHLARLQRSLAVLYGAVAPPDLPARLTARAGGLSGRHRLRIDAVPGPGGVRVTMTESALPAGPPTAVRLTPVPLPGGLGPHKLRDRHRLDGLADPQTTPLLVDCDGAVLEAAWGNVWLREDDRLITPPADGRLLPGITRARLLARAPELGFRAAAEPVTLERLSGAGTVFVTSALRLAVTATMGPGTISDAAWLAPVRAALLGGG